MERIMITEDHMMRMQRMLDDQLLNVSAAARARGVDRRTVVSWIAASLLTPITKDHLGRPLVRRGDVMAVIPPKGGRPPKNRGKSIPPSHASMDIERTNQ